MNSKTLLLALLVGVAIAIIAIAATSFGGDDDSGPTVACGAPVGEVDPTLASGSTLTPVAEPDDLPPAVLCAFDDDTPVDVATFLGGEPLVINFWATWCAPCVAEMPEFQQLHESTDAVRLVGINTQDAPPLARRFVEDLGITYDLVRDPGGDYYTDNNGFGMPTTLLVAPDGDIRYRHTGPLTLDDLAELIDQHLGVNVG